MDAEYVAAIATMQEQIRNLADSMKETRDAVKEIQKTLNSPDGPFVTHAEIKPLLDKTAELEDGLKKSNKRIDKLSLWRHWIMGGLAASGFLIGTGIALWKIIGHG